MNNNWYKDYLSETYRRQDDIKFAEAYRRANHDLDEVPQPGLGRRFFSAVGRMLVGFGRRLQHQQPVPRQDYAHDVET
jgi:hypothetical protein